MNLVDQTKFKLKQQNDFAAIVKAFKNRGVTNAYISEQIGVRRDGEDAMILPRSRITKIMKGESFPSAEQMAAIIGLAKREGIKWKAPKHPA